MGQHIVGIGQFEGGRQVGEMGSKRKHITARVAARGSVQKCQQQTGITLHRARNIDQDQDRQRLLTPRQAGQAHQLATRLRGLVHHPRPVDARTRTRWVHAPRCKVRQRQPHVASELLHQAVFGTRERVEVGMLQAIHVARRHHRIELNFLIFLLRLGLLAKGILRRQGLAHARATLAGLGLALGAGQQLRQQLLRHLGVTEIGVKQLAKDDAILLAADHHGFQRRADVLLLVHADSNRRVRCQCDA